MHLLQVQLAASSGQHRQPVAHQQGLLLGDADSGQVGTAVRVGASTFSPEPGGGAGPQQTEHVLGDAALALGVEHVVDRAQPVG